MSVVEGYNSPLCSPLHFVFHSSPFQRLYSPYKVTGILKKSTSLVIKPHGTKRNEMEKCGLWCSEMRLHGQMQPSLRLGGLIMTAGRQVTLARHRVHFSWTQSNAEGVWTPSNAEAEGPSVLG